MKFCRICEIEVEEDDDIVCDDCKCCPSDDFMNDMLREEAMFGDWDD